MTQEAPVDGLPENEFAEAEAAGTDPAELRGAGAEAVEPAEARTDPVEPAAPRRRSRRPLVIVASVTTAVLALSGAFLGWSILAESQLRSADDALRVAVEEHGDAERAFDARMRSVSTLLSRVRTVGAAPEFTADVSAEAEPFRAAIAALETGGQPTVPPLPSVIAENADDTSAAGAGASGTEGDAEGFRLPWAVQATAASTDELARQTVDATAALRSAADTAAGYEQAAEDAEAAYFGALGTRAEQTIADSPLATKSSKVDLTRQIEVAEDRASSASHDAAFVSAFSAAEQAVRDSQVQLAAEAADPDLAVRHDIEAYARSISNGITLDFVWAPEVSGLGEGWLSGTAQTWDTDGGWAIISLNFPVEEEWDLDTNPRAVVTHEVGHTQVYRENCWPLFSGPVFSEDHEMWATAWAISQGFDVPGSGIEAYGRPTDEQIEVAGQCR